MQYRMSHILRLLGRNNSESSTGMHNGDSEKKRRMVVMVVVATFHGMQGSIVTWATARATSILRSSDSNISAEYSKS